MISEESQDNNTIGAENSTFSSQKWNEINITFYNVLK